MAPVRRPAAASAGGNAFNPAIALILAGTATHTSLDPARYAITGFAVPPDVQIGPGTRGFSLGETELAMSASIDPWWRGAVNIALEPDNSVSVEEAFVQTTALGNGLTVKAGRFLSDIGYLNSQHAHTWDFIDAPLAYQAMLGGQFADDGLQLRWLAPTDQFIELGIEVGRGRSFPGTDTSRNGVGAATIALHTGGDIGDSHSWRAGVSHLSARASEQALTQLDANDCRRQPVQWPQQRHDPRRRCGSGHPTATPRTNFKLQGEMAAQFAQRHAGLRHRGRQPARRLCAGVHGLVPAGGLSIHAALARPCAPSSLDGGAVSYVGLRCSTPTVTSRARTR
jgi:hypothetical protein